MTKKQDEHSEMIEVLKKLAKDSFQDSFGSRIGFFGESISERKDVLLVWQYLRLNKVYRKHYRAVSRVIDEPGEYITHTPLELEKVFWKQFAAVWGMSKAVDYKEVKPPKGLSFKQNIIREVSLEKLLFDETFRNELRQVYYPNKSDHILPKAFAFFINPVADKSTVLKQVEKLFDNRKIRLDGKQINILKQPNRIFTGSTKSTMVYRLICYYLKTQTKTPTKEIKALYKEITGTTTTDKQISQFVDSFNGLSKTVPFCFFHTPKRGKN